jgi:hypothetical protein
MCSRQLAVYALDKAEGCVVEEQVAAGCGASALVSVIGPE